VRGDRLRPHFQPGPEAFAHALERALAMLRDNPDILAGAEHVGHKAASLGESVVDRRLQRVDAGMNTLGAGWGLQK